MNPPFTLEQFLQVFKSYNETVFPAQFGLYALAIICIYLCFKPTPTSGKVISSILAFFWLWMGVMYHLLFFTSINPLAYGFGVMFVMQGIGFLYVGVIRQQLRFQFKKGLYGMASGALVLFALVVYPVLGMALGHRYPSSPTFGLPCPTTIFTFGILLLSVKKFPYILWPIPLLWSVIGFMAAFHFGILEDTGLILSGLITLPLLIAHNQKMDTARNT